MEVLTRKKCYNYVGSHIGFSSTNPPVLLQTLKNLTKLDIYSAQITAGPHISGENTPPKVFNPSEWKTIKRFIKQTSFKLVIHSSYTINLAWHYPTRKDLLANNIPRRLLVDIINGEMIGAMAVIVHSAKHAPGKGSKGRQRMGNEKGFISRTRAIKRMARYMAWIVDEAYTNKNVRDCKLLLENSVGAGSEVTHTLKEMKKWWGYTQRPEVPLYIRTRLGFCIDTCHLFAAGEYNISTRSEVIRFFKEWNQEIGRKALICCHFNGSKERFGSSKDRHDSVIRSTHLDPRGLEAWKLYIVKYFPEVPLITELPISFEATLFEIAIIKNWSKSK